MENREIALELTKAWITSGGNTSEGTDRSPERIAKTFEAFMAQLRKEDANDRAEAKRLDREAGIGVS
jgi:hypothetical protein